MKELLNQITKKRLHEILFRKEPFSLTGEEIDLLAKIALKAKNQDDEQKEDGQGEE